MHEIFIVVAHQLLLLGSRYRKSFSKRNRNFVLSKDEEPKMSNNSSMSSKHSTNYLISVFLSDANIPTKLIKSKSSECVNQNFHYSI